MPLTPAYVERNSGDQIAPEVEKAHGGVSDNARLTEYVSWVGGRLLPNSKRGDEPHTFKVLNSDTVVNAFCLGNGNVYVTKGLLGLLDDEAELAAVLGHENGHFGNRHIASMIDASLGSNLVLGLAEAFYAAGRGGKLPAGSQALMDAAKNLSASVVVNGFSRQHEFEADEHGVRSAALSGYDPYGEVRVFEKIQKLSPEAKGIAVYLQSHPNASRRIEEVRADIVNLVKPGFEGEAFADRYRRIVRGGENLSSTDKGEFLGIPYPLAVAGGAVLALGVVAAVSL